MMTVSDLYCLCVIEKVFQAFLYLSLALTVEFSATSYTVSESGRFTNITVVKRGQTTFAVSVDFSTARNSAIG